MSTRVISAVAALFLAIGCSKAAVPEPRPDARPPEPVAVAPAITIDAAPVPTVAAVDAAPPSPDLAEAWTDEVVVRELAKDCAWRPKLPKEVDAIKDWQSDAKVSPLACDMHFAQSCAPDPCYGALVITCGPGCAKACDGCGAACAKTCTSCKKACTDEACKLACARSCGECHDGCVKEADRCRTGKCAAESRACYKAEYEKFTRMGCEGPCDAMSTCVGDCMSAPAMDTFKCVDKCGPKMGKCAKDYGYGCAVGWRPRPQ